MHHAGASSVLEEVAVDGCVMYKPKVSDIQIIYPGKSHLHVHTYTHTYIHIYNPVDVRYLLVFLSERCVWYNLVMLETYAQTTVYTHARMHAC